MTGDTGKEERDSLSWDQIKSAWATFLFPSKIRKEPEKYKKMAIDVLLSFLEDPEWLGIAVKGDVDPIPYLIIRFNLLHPFISKVAREMLKRWEIVWLDVLSNNQFIVDTMWERIPEIRPLLENEKVIDWLNRRIPEIKEFLWQYTENGTVEQRYADEARKLRPF